MVLILIFHMCYFINLSTYYPNVPHRYCQGMIIYETVTTYYFMGILNLIMIVRIYALYGQQILMTAFLILLFAGWILSAALCTIVYLPQHEFTAACGLANIKKNGFYIFAFTQVGVQAIFIMLTFGRTLSIKRALRGAGAAMRLIAPLLQRLTRDSYIMLALAAASAISAITFTTNKIPMNFIFYILFISTVGCRLILHTRRITPAQDPQPNTVNELNSPWNTNSALGDF
ncbi:hypothetical protein BDQ17DRAFT_1342602 [Cyathus striatus]|nr:hypothetical protein BDQ17DRAFT_1342602 [Cyathus striatus]